MVQIEEDVLIHGEIRARKIFSLREVSKSHVAMVNLVTPSSRALVLSGGLVEMALLRYLKAKDPYTAHHSDRVAAIARDIALEIGLSPERVRAIERGTRLHDIGKLTIPDGVLRKPSALSPEEREVLAQHPLHGARVLEPLKPFLEEEVVLIVLYHHERYDGKGYPEGRAGEGIPLPARIVAVADAYEAMTAGRPYQGAKFPEEALGEIQTQAGRPFDPEVVLAFVQAWRKEPIWRDKREYLRRTFF